MSCWKMLLVEIFVHCACSLALWLCRVPKRFSFLCGAPRRAVHHRCCVCCCAVCHLSAYGCSPYRRSVLFQMQNGCGSANETATPPPSSPCRRYTSLKRLRITENTVIKYTVRRAAYCCCTRALLFCPFKCAARTSAVLVCAAHYNGTNDDRRDLHTMRLFLYGWPLAIA